VIRVWIDGLCEPINPDGAACYGYIARRDGQFLFQGKGVVGEGFGMTSNVAEYAALCGALQKLIERDLNLGEPVKVYTDSQLVYQQMSGLWQARRGPYIRWMNLAKELASLFKNISFQWIPRERNREADALSRAAYEESRR